MDISQFWIDHSLYAACHSCWKLIANWGMKLLNFLENQKQEFRKTRNSKDFGKFLEKTTHKKRRSSVSPLNWNAPGKIIVDHAFMIKPRLWLISLYVAGSTDLASSVIAKILLHFFQSLAYDIISILHGLGDIHRRLFLIPILLLLWFIMVECAIYLYSYKATRTMETNYNNIWRVNLVPSSLRVAVPLAHTHTRTCTHTHEV